MASIIHAGGRGGKESMPMEPRPSRGFRRRWVPPAIFLASVLALYVEMVMIRWHATSSHAFAIFKNVSLLSCFFGLGIGYGVAGQKRVIGLAGFLPMLAGQILLFSIMSTTIGDLRVNPVAEQVVMGLPSEKWNWLQAVGGNFILAAIFLINAGMFIPMGYLSGRLMGRLPAMRGYALNLAGSLAGIGLFFLLSLVWSPPSVWMAVCVALAAVSRRSAAPGDRRHRQHDHRRRSGSARPTGKAPLLFAVPSHHAAATDQRRHTAHAYDQGQSCVLPRGHELFAGRCKRQSARRGISRLLQLAVPAS